MHEILELFARTEVFIFVFMEIMTKVSISYRIMHRVATWKDKTIFIALFGVFSIFGTLVGIPSSEGGGVANIRDLAPLFAGLAGGPVLGLGAGIIGGVHRFFYGGITAIPCGLSTILAGCIGGLIYMANKKRLIGVGYAILLAFAIEVMHAGLALLIARPFDQALQIVKEAIPPMMIANCLGIAVSVVVFDRLKPKEGE
jgi:phosphoserine phosphatase RsbU/P